MTSLARAFLAVYPPADVVAAVEERLVRVRERAAGVDLRWTAPDQLHVTMRFLGRVPDAEGLADAVADGVVGRPAVERLRLVGAGAFPKASRGSVLWLGIADGDARDALGSLATVVEAACVARGLPPADRPFRPHLSVARVRGGRAHDLRPLLEGLGPEPVGRAWAARDLRLVASETRPAGAVHVEVARFPLTG